MYFSFPGPGLFHPSLVSVMCLSLLLLNHGAGQHANLITFMGTAFQYASADPFAPISTEKRPFRKLRRRV